MRIHVTPPPNMKKHPIKLRHQSMGIIRSFSSEKPNNSSPNGGKPPTSISTFGQAMQSYTGGSIHLYPTNPQMPYIHSPDPPAHTQIHSNKNIKRSKTKSPTGRLPSIKQSTQNAGQTRTPTHQISKSSGGYGNIGGPLSTQTMIGNIYNTQQSPNGLKGVEGKNRVINSNRSNAIKIKLGVGVDRTRPGGGMLITRLKTTQASGNNSNIIGMPTQAYSRNTQHRLGRTGSGETSFQNAVMFSSLHPTNTHPDPPRDYGPTVFQGPLISTKAKSQNSSPTKLNKPITFKPLNYTQMIKGDTLTLIQKKGKDRLLKSQLEGLRDFLLRSNLEVHSILIQDFDSNEISFISEIIKKGKNEVQSFDYKSCDFGEGGLSCIENAFNNPNMRSLSMTDCKNVNFNHTDMSESTISSLSITQSDLLGKHLHELTECLYKNRLLRSLNLSDNKLLGNTCGVYLGDTLMKNNYLQTVNLDAIDLGDEGAVALAHGLRNNSSILTLSLNRNVVGDVGAKAFSNALKTNTHLQELNLHYNRIGDKGIVPLINLFTSHVHIGVLNNIYGRFYENIISILMDKKARGLPMARGHVNGYEKLHQMGKGSFGCVYLCSHEHGIFAMKQISVLDDKAKEKVMREVNIMKILNQRNIIKFKEYFTLGPYLYIIMDLGLKNLEEAQSKQETEYSLELPEAVRKNLKKIPLLPEYVYKWGRSVAEAIYFLHGMGIAHLDLKPANILLNDEKEILVTDFGISNDRAGVEYIKAQQATVAFAAPEILMRLSFQVEPDIFALGVLLYQLATGKLPFMGRTKMEMAAHILESESFPPDIIPAYYSNEFLSLIEECLVKERKNRIKIQEVLTRLDKMHFEYSTKGVEYINVTAFILNPGEKVAFVNKINGKYALGTDDKFYYMLSEQFMLDELATLNLLGSNPYFPYLELGGDSNVNITYYSNYTPENLQKDTSQYEYTLQMPQLKENLLNIILDEYGNIIQQDKKQILIWLLEICTGMKYLHSNNLCHNRLEAGNIFLDSKGNIKITGFWLSLMVYNYSVSLRKFSEADKKINFSIDYNFPFPNLPHLFEEKDIACMGKLWHELCTGQSPLQAMMVGRYKYKGIKETYGKEWAGYIRTIIKRPKEIGNLDNLMKILFKLLTDAYDRDPLFCPIDVNIKNTLDCSYMSTITSIYTIYIYIYIL